MKFLNVRNILAISKFQAPHVSKGTWNGSFLAGPLPDGQGLDKKPTFSGRLSVIKKNELNLK
jgi:hypothetical protein